MASKAALELIVQMQDKASKGLDAIAKKGGLLNKTFAGLHKTGGIVTGGLKGLAGGFGKLITPVGLIGAGVTALAGVLGKNFVDAANEAEQAEAQLNAVLTSTKGIANVTSEAAQALANKLSSAGGLSRASGEAILAGEAMLLTFTNVRNGVGAGNQIFDQATQTILDMATAMNSGAAPSAEQLAKQSIQLGKALNDPIAGIGALSKVGVTFTDQQKEQIKTMVEAGDVMGAQKLILGELAAEFGGSALASAQTFAGQMDTLNERVGDVKERIGMALLPALKGVVEWLSGPEIGAGIEAFASGIEKGIEKVIGFVTSPTFKAAFEGVKDVIGGAFSTAFELAVRAVEFAAPKIEAAVSFIKPRVEIVVEWSKEKINAAIDYFKSDEFQGALATAKENIRSFAEDAWDKIGPAVTKAKDDYLVPFFNWLKGPEVSSALDNIGTAINDMMTSKIELAGKAFDTAKTVFIQPFLEFISNKANVEALGSFGQAVLTTVVEAFDALNGAAGLALTAVKDLFNIFNTPVVPGTVTGQNGGGFGGYIKTEIEALTTIFNTLGDAIGAVNDGLDLYNSLKNKDVKLDTPPVEILPEKFDPSKMFPGGGLFDFIQDAAQNAMDAVSSTFKNAKAAADLKAMGASAQKALEGQWGISSPSKVFLTIGLMAMLGLSSGILTGGGTARAAAVATGANVRAAVAGPLSPGQFAAIGLNIGLGLASGIRAGTPSAVAAARSMALQVAAAARTELAIKSPSKVFEKMGEQSTGGYSVGWEKGTPAVLAAVESSINQVIELAKRVVGKGTEDLMKAFSSITDAVSGAFDLTQQMGSEDFAAPGLWKIQMFMKSLDDILVYANAELQKRKGILTEVNANLSKFMGEMVGGFSSAVDVLGSMGEEGFNVPFWKNIDRFFDALDRFLGHAIIRLQLWKGKYSEVEAQLAKAVGDTVAGLTGAVNGLKALEEAGAIHIGQHAMTFFFAALDRMLTEFDKHAKAWAKKADEESAKLAGYVGQTVSGVLGAVDSLKKLGAAGPLVIHRSTLTLYFAGLDSVLDKFGEYAKEWKKKADEKTVQLAGYVASTVSGVIGGLDSLLKLGKADMLMPGRFAIAALFSMLDRILDQFQLYAKAWDEKASIETAQLSDAVGKTVSGVLAALDGILKLGQLNLVWPGRFAIAAFFSILDQMIDTFSKYQEAWAEKFNDKSAELSATASKVVTGVLGALDSLLKLADEKVVMPSNFIIAAFFSTLDKFLTQFTLYAKVWSEKATDKTAALAGYIGEIVTNINKALDPILKMKDASAVTGGQIEGALANVWAALDQFNKVMIGGSEGTPFQGEWADRAVVFAQKVGTIFTELQKALGMIGDVNKAGEGGGLGKFLADIRTMWMTVFGPATQEGTFLYAIFGKPSGMFNWMDNNLPTYMGFSAGVWKTALEGLQAAIGAQLALMKTALYNDALAVGQAIAQGIADGLTGGAPGYAPPAAPPQNGGASNGAGLTINGLTINAGAGANGGQIARDFLQALDEELGLDRRATSWVRP